MDSRNLWKTRIEETGKQLGFQNGYKILYVPWKTIGTTDTVFLSLNPGRAREGVDLFTLSDERGNSYKVEEFTARSPITQQFLLLSDMLGLPPNQILTGVVAPFRSDRWSSLSSEQRRKSLEIGTSFWEQVFAARRPKRVITCCPEAAIMSSKLLESIPDISINSGWGNTLLRRYRSRDGAIVVQVPHLSTFKLLSRPECHEPLRIILDLPAP